MKAVSPLLTFNTRTVIPLGVMTLFEATRVDRPRALNFAFVSQPQRGLAPTCRVWVAKVHSAVPTATLHVFGSTPEQARIAPEAAEAARIMFHPRTGKQELAQFYETATGLICIGAEDETFCLAAAEAQCAGLPVLTLGVGALSERVSHGVNGLQSASFDSLAQDVIRLCKDTELTSILRAGALRMRGQFTWERSAKLWEDFISSLSKSI